MTITYPDTRLVTIKGEVLELCRHHGKLAEIGGTSRLRNAEDRAEYLSEDQLVGQLGHCAATYLLTGSLDHYTEAREKANANPTAGDKGQDWNGSNLDIKTSLVRPTSNKSSLDYTLLVRPSEKHPDWVYLQTLVLELKDESASILVLGWASTRMLPKDTVSDEPWGGDGDPVYALKVRKLNPIMPMFWKENPDIEIFSYSLPPVEQVF